MYLHNLATTLEMKSKQSQSYITVVLWTSVLQWSILNVVNIEAINWSFVFRKTYTWSWRKSSRYGFHEIWRISREIWWISWNPADIRWSPLYFVQILWNLADFRWNPADFMWISWNPADFKWNLADFVWISWNLVDFRWNPVDFVWIS